jgi:HEAT repeat protein
LRHDGLTAIDPDANPPEPSIEATLEGLRSADSKRVFRAVLDLHRFGERAGEAVPDLLRIISMSEDLGCRQFAVNMLGTIAPHDPRTRIAVLKALDDESALVRREALQAFISTANLSATDLDRIVAMKDDPDKDVARWSAIALRNIEARHDDAEPGDATEQRDG